MDGIYDKIKAYVSKHMVNNLKSRHYEDCVQDMILQYLEGRTNFKWIFIDYLRKNGLHSKRGKLTAKTIEKAYFIGEDNYIIENQINKTLDKKEILEESEFIILMDEFLSNLNLNLESRKWAMKIQKMRLLSGNRKGKLNL